jgi:hypothetical protein
LLAGFFLPWTIRPDASGEPSSIRFYSDDHPVACAILAGTAVVSIALMCAGRARGLVSLLNLMAASIILLTLAYTREQIAAANRIPHGSSLSLWEWSWMTMLAGVCLNVLASFVQPPPDW